MHPSRSRLIAPQNPSPGREMPNCRWTIVIAKANVELPEAMLRACGPQPMIVLASHSFGEGDALPASTLDLLADTVLHRDVEAIVVLGQSDDAPSPSRTQHGAQHETSSGYRRILRRTADRMNGRHRSQNRLRTQMTQIRQDPRLATASISQAISICGLYHVIESNLFLLYDETKDQFVPLVDASSLCA